MGGNQVAFQEKIRHNHIDPTIDIIEHFILKPSKLNEWQLLGSQKKKEDSGDIDLGIDIKSNLKNNYEPKEQAENTYNIVLDTTQKFFFNSDNNLEEHKRYIQENGFIYKQVGLGLISFTFPQVNEKYQLIPNNNKPEAIIKWVQLDLIFGNLDFMKNYTDTLYDSDFLKKIDKEGNFETTDYKGKLKNWLLLASLNVLTTREENVDKYSKYSKKTKKNGPPLSIKSKITLNFNGIKKIYQEYRENRNGNITKTTIHHKYLDIKFLDFFKKVYKDDNVSYNNLISVENLVSYLKNNPYTRKHYKEILKEYKGFFVGSDKDFPIIAEL